MNLSAYRDLGRARIQASLHRRARRRKLRWLKATTAQLALDNLYPLRKEPPCPTQSPRA